MAIQGAILMACTAMSGTSSPEHCRHLSPSIAPKRNLLAVDLTVSSAKPEKKSC